MVKWRDAEMSLDYPPLDDGNKVFLQAIHRATEMVIKKHDLSGMSAMFDTAYGYARNHFPLEEDLMERIDYPGLKDHRSAHELFIKNIAGFRLAYNRAETQVKKLEMARKAMAYLSLWFPGHLLKVDKPIKPYFVRLRNKPPRMNY